MVARNLGGGYEYIGGCFDGAPGGCRATRWPWGAAVFGRIHGHTKRWRALPPPCVDVVIEEGGMTVLEYQIASWTSCTICTIICGPCLLATSRSIIL